MTKTDKQRKLPGMLWITLLALVVFGCTSGRKNSTASTIRLRWVLGAPQIDPLLCEESVATEMGYFRERGIDVEVTPIGGGARTVQVVASGGAEIGYIGAEPMILNAAEGKDPGIVQIFNQNRDPIFNWVVLPNSPIQSIRDVKGKPVGTQSLGSSGTFYARGELMSLGLDPDKDVEFVAVGSGAGEQKMLETGEIAALVEADTILASMENVGTRFRYLPKTEYTDSYFQGGLFVRRDYLKAHRDALCAFARGIAMGVEFTLENPEAALKIHWKVYPESKPKGMSDEQAMRFSLHVLESRMHKWDPSDELIKKHGAYSHEEWVKIVEKMGLKAKVTDDTIKSFYSNDLVDCGNDFDAGKVRADARNYR